jgi:hypothetical protein
MGSDLEPLSEFLYCAKLLLNLLFTTSEKMHGSQEIVVDFLSSSERLTIFTKE